MCFPAELIDGGQHVGRAQESFVIWIDEMCEGRLTACQFDELLIVGTVTARAPAISATLQHPESHHVLQQARRPVNAAFISEIQSEGLGSDHWCIEFGANQRPGSGTQECSAIASCDRGDGRSGVVAGGSNHRSRGQRGVLCKRRQQHPYN